MQYVKGQSGNYAGRPRGSKGRRTALFEELIQPNQEALAKKAVEMAIEGNEPMLKLLLERLLPPKPKDVEDTLEIESIGDTPTDKSRHILEMVSKGDLSIEQGQKLMKILADQMKIFEEVELGKQIQVLKEMISTSNQF